MGVLEMGEDPVELAMTKLPSTGDEAVAVASSSRPMSRSRWGRSGDQVVHDGVGF